MMSARWDNHFLQLCIDHARMSKDPNTRVGAVIVGPDKEIRSLGFNGFPRGIADTPWRLSDRETKLRLVVHAETNAILAAARIGTPVKGCTIYLAATDDTGEVWGGPPCARCVLDVIQAGISTVISRPRKLQTKWGNDLDLARSLLTEAGIAFYEVPQNV